MSKRLLLAAQTMPIDLYSIVLILGGFLGLFGMFLVRGRIWKLGAATLILLCAIFYFNLYCASYIRYISDVRAGNSVAKRELGKRMMHYQRGAPYNPRLGLQLLSDAARAGDSLAQVIIACHYLTGISAPADLNVASNLLDRATQSGNQTARTLLGAIEGTNQVSKLSRDDAYAIAVQIAHGQREP